MADEKRVLVLGGGVVGTASAYYLARRGFRVTLVERRDGVALETSFANGGLLTPSMSDPWAAPGIPGKILGWMGREDSPFLVRPGAIPGLAAWGLRFLANCNQATWRRNTATILRLCGYSHRTVQELTRETGIAYDLNSRGTLNLFRDRLSMEGAQRTAEVMGELGVAYHVLDASACVELEPALAGRVEQISGGIHYPDDEAGDAHRFSRRLAELAAGEGVAFRHGETVERIETRDGTFDAAVTDAGRLEAEACVVALGNASVPLLRPLGIRLPIYPVKGYSVTFSTEGWNGAPLVPLVDSARKIGIVRMGDRIRVVGSAEFTGPDDRVNPKRTASLKRLFLESFPDFPDPDSGEAWAGLRPMTPDGIPYLGATPLGGLYLNTGHGHLGWTMSCGSAKVVADLIAGAEPEIDLAGMRLGDH
jgi:D-amino-acid dehydrogenase